MPFYFNDKQNFKFSETIDLNYIIKNDVCSNIILNYILDEFDRLINYNTNKIIKTNITHFIVDIICTLFNEYNKEISLFNKDINIFNQILYTSEFYLETQNINLMIDAIDYYDNQHSLEQIESMDEDKRNKVLDDIYDDIEEMEALDIGDEIIDEEGMFDLYSNYDFME
jgi:hypothetical protein